jgi:multiple sugar transport system permease protein
MTTSRGIMSNIEARSPKGRFILGLFLVILILVSLIVLFPFVYSFTAGLKTSVAITKSGVNLWPAEPLWENYVQAWNKFKMITMFGNTFWVAGGGVVFQLFVSTLAAFFLSRLKPAGFKVIMALVFVTMTVPRIAYLVPLYITLADVPIFHFSLINSYWGLWLPYAVNPFMILVLKSAFDNVPQDIYDAAQVDGASKFRLFYQFTIPLSTSIMLILGLLSFISLWGDFLLPLLVLRDPSLQTISVRLYNMTRNYPLNLFMAGSFIAMVPPLLAAVFLQRYMKGGLTF